MWPEPRNAKQRQPGHGGVGAAAGPLTVSARHVGLLAGLMGARVPAAVGGLIVGQPSQRGFYRGLRLGRAAVTLRHAGTVGGHAEPIGVGHGLLAVVAAVATSRRQSQFWRGRMRPAAALSCPPLPALDCLAIAVTGLALLYAASATTLPATRSTGFSRIGIAAAGSPTGSSDVGIGHFGQGHNLFQQRGRDVVRRGAGRRGWPVVGQAFGRLWFLRIGHDRRGGIAALGGRRFDGRGPFARGRSLGRLDDGRRFRAEQFRLGQRHVIDGRSAGQLRILGADQALRLRRPIGLATLQFGALRRRDGLAGKYLPRLILHLGQQRRRAAGRGAAGPARRPAKRGSRAPSATRWA